MTEEVARIRSDLNSVTSDFMGTASMNAREPSMKRGILYPGCNAGGRGNFAAHAFRAVCAVGLQAQQEAFRCVCVWSPLQEFQLKWEDDKWDKYSSFKPICLFCSVLLFVLILWSCFRIIPCNLWVLLKHIYNIFNQNKLCYCVCVQSFL